MYYSIIGMIAFLILVIENQDILLNLNNAFERPEWKVYRKFLVSVMVYYVSDILWGIFEWAKMPRALFIDTSFYFIAMAVGILFWTSYVVTYLDDNNRFGTFLVSAGRAISALVFGMTIVNIFVPVLFSVDENCVYDPHHIRYVLLLLQIILLILISVYASFSYYRCEREDKKRKRYLTIIYFGPAMTVFLIAQTVFPYLPLYSIAFLFGTCLIHTIVIGSEKEEFRRELEDANKVMEFKQSITSLLDNMPALSFSKDVETGIYLACNQAFAEYAHKESPDEVIGLTDAQIFDEVTAAHFVEDDKMALSMDEPYIFFEDVPDAVGNQRQFQTTKLKFIDTAGRLCILGMCQDVTDMVRVQRENATTKEAYEKARSTSIIYTHIAHALARSFTDLFYVNVENGEYIEYRIEEETGHLSEARRGPDFFGSCKKEVESFVFSDDHATFEAGMDRENLMDALKRNGNFTMTYRLLTDGEPRYVSLKASQMDDDDRFIVIGVTDVDEEMQHRRLAERIKEEQVAYKRLNSLTGDFLCVYTVVPETGRYREYSSTDGFKSLDIPREGLDFFKVCREQMGMAIYSEDRDRVLSLLTQEGVLSQIEKRGIFTLSFRLMIEGLPNHVRLRAATVEEDEGKRLIVGINDIDSHVKQEEDYARKLARAQNKANIDALTGVKSKHAYLDEEEKIDRQISQKKAAPFAIVILDINDLKKVNDTEGHQAGDRYICDASRIICNTFKHSPVFRIGGDEFAVITRGNDYLNIHELVDKIREQNEIAQKEGGVVIACGMADYEKGDCVAQVFERADQHMYENKCALKAEK